MKTYGGVDVYILILLTSVQVGSEWSASRPSRFTPGESAPGTHWIRGWVGIISVQMKIAPPLSPSSMPAAQKQSYLEQSATTPC
jgi:hypothetical protein